MLKRNPFLPRPDTENLLHKTFRKKINDIFFDETKKSKVYFIFTIRGGYEDTKAQNDLIYSTGAGGAGITSNLSTIPFAKELLSIPMEDCSKKDLSILTDTLAVTASAKPAKPAKPRGGRKSTKRYRPLDWSTRHRCTTYRKNRPNFRLSKKV
jgi:hypothetical protein